MSDPLRDPLALDTSGPTQRFSDAKIQQRVDAALASLAPDRKGSVVAVATEQGAALAFVARPAEGWSVSVAVEKPRWRARLDDLKLEARVVYSW